jgi:hypothetical protein
MKGPSIIVVDGFRDLLGGSVIVCRLYPFTVFCDLMILTPEIFDGVPFFICWLDCELSRL